jgi:molecular chaperone GrpE (heat shock protein)
MNDDYPLGSETPAAGREDHTLGSSTIYRLCEEVIALREYDKRQLRSLEQTLAKVRDELKTSFNSFAADTQRAYQGLRQEVQGEKKFSLNLLLTVLEIGQELEHLTKVGGEVDPANPEAVKGFVEGVAVQSRKVQATLKRLGVVPYEPQLGSAYDPKLHERVGSDRFEGMGPLLVGKVVEPGYASQQPDFKLVRAKVIVSE